MHLLGVNTVRCVAVGVERRMLNARGRTRWRLILSDQAIAHLATVALFWFRPLVLCRGSSERPRTLTTYLEFAVKRRDSL
eukprot:COSAG02_NODE_40_length_47766_cov_88.053119_18_plen_80_part_00